MRIAFLAGLAPVLGIVACGPAGQTDVEIVPLPSVAAAGSGQARLTMALDGRPILSWIEALPDSEALKYAIYEDGAFGTPRLVVERPDLLVNWADFPSVVQLGENLWAAHWLVRQDDSFFAYDIEYAVSADGRSFGPGRPLNVDGAEAEHGFVDLFAWEDGIGAVWLDGRALADVDPSVPRHPPVGTELRLARIDAAGEVVSRDTVDTLVCDCCQPDVAAGAGGPVLTYRDRTPDEIRDVVVRRLTGGAFGEPTTLGEDGWQIEGCPVNGPAIAARGPRAAVAWFTAADGRPRVELAWSTDGGATFGAAIEVDAEGAFGQADVVLVDDGAIVSWWRRAAGGGIELALRRVGMDGALGGIRVVTSAPDLTQPLDVPQLVRAGDALLVAWTAFDETLTVRTARVTGLP